MDETHHPARRSWVESAQGSTDFPIQNLPFGIFRPRDDVDEPARVGMAIGDQILDLVACHDEGWFTGAADRAGRALASPALNPLMELGRDAWSAVRTQASTLLATDSAAYRANRRVGERILVPMRDAELLLPATIGGYTDFYASVTRVPTRQHVPFGTIHCCRITSGCRWIPRPRLVHRAERCAGAPAAPATEGSDAEEPAFASRPRRPRRS